MIILSHRGFWVDQVEKNGLTAFKRTIESGFGTETDIRDRDASLVVSHDPANSSAVAWLDLLDMFEGSGLPLAVNVKADGLSEMVASSLAGRNIDAFMFDMSGPETVRYAKAGLPFFTRHSDLELDPILYESANGVWLDSFGPEWFDREVIQRHLDRDKKVCVVSSELHGRDARALWDMLDGCGHAEGLMICTDLPLQAAKRFAS
ncbi:hypothetical protein [Brevundimonas intermedia]|uniref:hypothetical protein n=1 Tax=Brevundimonas intermedia TaxID=74315 RepID=UPI0032088229